MVSYLLSYLMTVTKMSLSPFSVTMLSLFSVTHSRIRNSTRNEVTSTTTRGNLRKSRHISRSEPQRINNILLIKVTRVPRVALRTSRPNTPLRSTDVTNDLPAHSSHSRTSPVSVSMCKSPGRASDGSSEPAVMIVPVSPCGPSGPSSEASHSFGLPTNPLSSATWYALSPAGPSGPGMASTSLPGVPQHPPGAQEKVYLKIGRASCRGGMQ